MQKQLTVRTKYLVTEAAALIGQAIYEGDHIKRDEPSPAADSPWSRPDLPAEVLVALQAAKVALLHIVAVYDLEGAA